MTSTESESTPVETVSEQAGMERIARADIQTVLERARERRRQALSDSKEYAMRFDLKQKDICSHQAAVLDPFIRDLEALLAL